jgi:hypothetical protein
VELSEEGHYDSEPKESWDTFSSGLTEMDVGDIREKAQAIIDNWGDYHLLRHSCQHFALRLLHEVCTVVCYTFRVPINISLFPMGGCGPILGMVTRTSGHTVGALKGCGISFGGAIDVMVAVKRVDKTRALFRMKWRTSENTKKVIGFTKKASLLLVPRRSMHTNVNDSRFI